MESDFPIPKQRTPPQTFEIGDRVIVTTGCEDIELHDLKGTVRLPMSTGSYSVIMDVDGTRAIFLPHEIGHYY